MLAGVGHFGGVGVVDGGSATGLRDYMRQAPRSNPRGSLAIGLLGDGDFAYLGPVNLFAKPNDYQNSCSSLFANNALAVRGAVTFGAGAGWCYSRCGDGRYPDGISMRASADVYTTAPGDVGKKVAFRSGSMSGGSSSKWATIALSATPTRYDVDFTLQDGADSRIEVGLDNRVGFGADALAKTVVVERVHLRPMPISDDGFDAAATNRVYAKGGGEQAYDAAGRLIEAGLGVWSRRKNGFLQSRKFDGNSWERLGGMAAPVEDAIGILGDVNGATTITDSGGFDQGIRQYAAVLANTDPVVTSVFIKKDQDQSRFAELQLRLHRDPAALKIKTQINTATGAVTVREKLGTGAAGAIDMGAWWRFYAYLENDGTSARASARFYPAVTDAFGVNNAAASGSVTIDQFQLDLGFRHPGPVIVTGSARRTRPADTPSETYSGQRAVVADFLIPKHFRSQTVFEIAAAAQNDFVLLRVENGTARLRINSGGRQQANLSLGTVPENTLTRVAASWGRGAAHAAMNGAIAVSDLSVVDPANPLSNLHVGVRRGGSECLDGFVKRIELIDTISTAGDTRSLSALPS